MIRTNSFFGRLSGNTPAADPFDSFDEEPTTLKESRDRGTRTTAPAEEPTEGSGQLPVDVHQTANEIVIRAFVAGVRPDELSISISRDMVEIQGSRMEREGISGPDYFVQELFWGSFSRTITLPQEVNVEASSATSKDGLLTLILPKLDRARQTKLRVKAG